MARHLQADESIYSPLYISGNYYNCAINALAKGVIAGAADRLEVAPFIPPINMTWDRVRVNPSTGVASALARAVIYDSDGTGNLPSTLLANSTDLDCSVTNSVPEDATFSYTLIAGHIYWVGVHYSSTASLRGIAVGGSLNLGTPSGNGAAHYTTLRLTGQTFASGAPATFGSGALTSQIIPEVKFRIT